ncbi:MAG: hypothetical protein IJT82_03475 [Schwartzia sp.]|nr:hypothetical protein [Schwartzia sp. (in: firmicutes)]
MSMVSQLYKYYQEHPESDNKTVGRDLDWEDWQVKQQKCKLKTRGFITVNDDGTVAIARPMALEDVEPVTRKYKLEIYRGLIAEMRERLESENTTNKEAIEICREIRIMMKEIF